MPIALTKSLITNVSSVRHLDLSGDRLYGSASLDTGRWCQTVHHPGRHAGNPKGQQHIHLYGFKASTDPWKDLLNEIMD